MRVKPGINGKFHHVQSRMKPSIKQPLCHGALKNFSSNQAENGRLCHVHGNYYAHTDSSHLRYSRRPRCPYERDCHATSKRMCSCSTLASTRPHSSRSNVRIPPTHTRCTVAPSTNVLSSRTVSYRPGHLRQPEKRTAIGVESSHRLHASIRLGSNSHQNFIRAQLQFSSVTHTCLLLAHSVKNSLPSSLHVSSST